MIRTYGMTVLVGLYAVWGLQLVGEDLDNPTSLLRPERTSSFLHTARFRPTSQDADLAELGNRAKQITDNNWGNILVAALVTLGVQMLIPLSLYIGAIFVAPFVSLMWGVIFVELKRLSSQPER